MASEIVWLALFATLLVLDIVQAMFERRTTPWSHLSIAKAGSSACIVACVLVTEGVV